MSGKKRVKTKQKKVPPKNKKKPHLPKSQSHCGEEKKQTDKIVLSFLAM